MKTRMQQTIFCVCMVHMSMTQPSQQLPPQLPPPQRSTQVHRPKEILFSTHDIEEAEILSLVTCVATTRPAAQVDVATSTEDTRRPPTRRPAQEAPRPTQDLSEQDMHDLLFIMEQSSEPKKFDNNE